MSALARTAQRGARPRPTVDALSSDMVLCAASGVACFRARSASRSDTKLQWKRLLSAEVRRFHEFSGDNPNSGRLHDHHSCAHSIMIDAEAELAEVQQELREVEEDLNVLLLRQSELLDRKQRLQRQLEGEQREDGGASSARDTEKPTQDWKATFEWTQQIHALLKETVRRITAASL
ncbi:unnamed protein product [Phytophthora lilii]|uniref:Unnamed protein product n=1 Tax=Phytophthora lilii TaxID=2077276 RepID=A0A9W6TUH6_9STRA|nr:unnamed protein product [Phytophthora lilii]